MSLKIGIVGVGAVGGYYGLKLVQSGENVHFYLRTNFGDVKRHGFTLIHCGDEEKTDQFDSLSIYQDSTEIGICDWVIIAAKAIANDQICELVKPMVNSKTSFLTLQNGMGNVENIASVFGANRTILAGLCFTCINRTDPTTIESILPGYVQFGQFGGKIDTKAEDLIRCFEHAGIKLKRTESLDEALWRKLCWNVPFNGLSIAAGGITTDIILNTPNLRTIARELMLEIQAGAKAHMIEIEDSFLNKQFSLTQPMGPYKPSSLIDFLSQKAVEVDAIWGEPLRRAEKNGVQMPELKKLHSQLLRLTYKA